jgi:hypothetical protein
MRIAGRINLMLLGVVIVVGLIAVFLFAGRGGPTETANKFMIALSRGDVDDLMKLTFVRNGEDAAMRKDYEFATQEASRYYTFIWRVKDEKQANDNTASVQLSVIRNVVRPGSFEENFEIPLVRTDGKWLVDVVSINGDLYPALPREDDFHSIK